jgi:hypothetical protein
LRGRLDLRPKNEAEAKADALIACLLLLGDRWSETVELVE